MTYIICKECGRAHGDHYIGCSTNLRASSSSLIETPAGEILIKAAAHMEERSKTYDEEDGERSMGKTVAAFNAITGAEITEAQGWLLMQLLKDVRLFTRPGYHADSAEDAIAYAALKAEAKQKEQIDN